jgi:arylsulfatase
LPEDIEKYKETYKVGWDAIREARYKKMIRLGLLDSSKAPLSPRWKNELSWEQNPDKEWDARAMAVHAAMVDRMDQGIGKIITALKEAKQLDNTLILFLSDNGASPENSAGYGPGFDRPNETRSGLKVSFSVKKDVLPGSETTFASIGERWANVSNTPYQLWKAESYEGGIRTPMIAFWPKGITAKKGSFTNQLGHVMDLMATFVDIGNASYPKEFNGNKITPIEGLSLAPIFKSKSRTAHKVLFNEHFGAKYVRTQEWKLVARNGEKWHLYHLNDDETELNDLAEKNPSVVQQLDLLWNDWASSHNVLPKIKAK